MKKKSSATRGLLKNLNRLIPFVGFLLVLTGILGLLFVQTPLEESQDVRSDAAENQEIFFPNILPTTSGRTLYVDETTTISFDLNLAQDMSVKSMLLIFNIINDSIDVPLVTVNAGSGLKADTIEVEEVTDGYLVKVIATPNNIDWPEPPKDTSFLKISLRPQSEGTLTLSFDTNVSHIQDTDYAYAIDAPTVNYDVEVRPIVCQEDTFHCEDGTVVHRVPPDCNFESCPDVEPTPTTIKSCNERCDSNADCEVGYRCFDTGSEKRCRLATSPSSSNCTQVYDQTCNQYCTKSDDCVDGLGCWDNRCRNPENIDSTTCADLTPTQRQTSINSCGEYCSSNANCAVNLRCYNNVCRLASNPSSLTCSAATQKTVSAIYEEEGRNDTALTKVMLVPVQKGDNIIPDDDSQSSEDVEIVEPTERVEMTGDDEVPVDETVFDLLFNMLKDNKQGLPTAILVIGGILLLASLLTLLLAKALKYKSRKTTLPKDLGRSINVESHHVEAGKTPTIQPSSLIGRKLSPEKKAKLMENEKVKEVMSSHKSQPRPPEEKSQPRPMIKPMVKESPVISHGSNIEDQANKNDQKSSENTPKADSDEDKDQRVKDLLKKINDQSDKQNKG